ncbi:MAG TPA: ATP synthase F1 subunit gamma [Moorella mulderi]|nr:ATP synthase F1 subunit gamma [Moorella mulderi]
MLSMRDIKRRIRAIKNIQQITRAMKMVAAAKLRRSQGQLLSSRPYFQKLEEVIGRLASAPEARNLPLIAEREVKRVGYVVITSDRGLAGPYNSNIIRVAEAALLQEHRDRSMVLIGKKGWQFFRRYPFELLEVVTDIGDEPTLLQAREISSKLVEFFLKKRVDEIQLVYMHFISALRHMPKVDQFLPIIPAPLPERVREREYLYEPEPLKVLEYLLPRYCEMRIYQALLEAKASEHAARMMAMENASKNAEEMIDQLTLSFNKARQAAITKEILEVVTGAEALKWQGQI